MLTEDDARALQDGTRAGVRALRLCTQTLIDELPPRILVGNRGRVAQIGVIREKHQVTGAGRLRKRLLQGRREFVHACLRRVRRRTAANRQADQAAD